MKRGEVYRFNLDPAIGSELQKARPCVVVQRDSGTERATMTIVCPIAGARGREANLLNPVIPAGAGGMIKESRIVCNQIRSMDLNRVVGAKAGDLPASIMAEVDRGLRAILDLS